ncbi:MAG: hypothetical protein R3C45_03855 [Phycisphaerales bacterium]
MNPVTQNEPWYAAGDPWVLTQNAWDPDKNIYFETIFTQSNGYMGIRGYTEENETSLDCVREGYLAGVFAHTDEAALKQTRVTYDWPMLAMVTLPELFACEVNLDGEVFRLSEGTVISFNRSLNMRNGELVRSVVWRSPSGHRTKLVFKRFLSAAVPHLAVQEISVTPGNWSGTAVLRFEQDTAIPTYFRCGDRSFEHLPQDLLTDQHIENLDDDAVAVTLKTVGTGHTVGISSQLVGDFCRNETRDPKKLRQLSTMTLKEGQTGVVLHAVAVTSSRDKLDDINVSRASRNIAKRAMLAGYQACLDDSTQVWTQRWALSDVAIDGPARDQAYLRYSTFNMLQMAPFHTDNMSVPARAYSYNRYHGLYYWDSEAFLLAQYLYTHPQVARNLLQFRYRTLPGARRNAKHLESPGACFPWMTDSDDGTEQGPWHLGDYLWHQNADIAYAIDQYVRSTNDTAFMRDAGLEILIESARFWMSRLEEDEEGVVHLHDTVGPDELDKHGKDNGFTSLMCRRHLRLAAQWIVRMREKYPDATQTLLKRLKLSAAEVKTWEHAADRLSAPMIPGMNIPLQDEFLLAKKPLDFTGLTADEAYAKRHTHRVVKQSDIVMVMYLLQDEFTTEQMQTAYDFYEPMTLHFSSLSYNTHSILASMIGRKQQAYDYFTKAAGLDLDNLRDATSDGLHAAALGGTWQTVAYGFLGMRLADEGIEFKPRLHRRMAVVVYSDRVPVATRCGCT